jgi:hypothetical protein
MDGDVLRRLKEMAIIDGIKQIKASPDWKVVDKERFLIQKYGEAYTKNYRAGDNLTPEGRRLYGQVDSRDMPVFHILDFGDEHFEFRRVALTDEQVNDPELQLDKLDEKQRHELNWKNLRPIDRDFVNKHGSLYEVELDGLAIKDQFEDIVVDAVDEYFDWDLWEKCVKYEIDGALPKAQMDVQMLESLHELNMKFGYKNKKVKDHDIIDIRKKAFDRQQELRGRYLAIEGRFEGRQEWLHLKDGYDWLARQEAKGKNIGEEDFSIEEE